MARFESKDVEQTIDPNQRGLAGNTRPLSGATLMNENPATDDSRRFANLIPQDARTDPDHVHLAGSDWYLHVNGNVDMITHHRPEAKELLSITRLDGLFRWTWSRRLSEGVFAEMTGTSENLEDACAQALAFVPIVERLSYDGWELDWIGTGTGTGNGAHRSYTAAIGDDRADVRWSNHPGEHGNRWRWQRAYPPAGHIADLLHGTGLGGAADSVHAAMIATIEAPHELRRACAELIATLHAQHPNAPDEGAAD